MELNATTTDRYKVMTIHHISLGKVNKNKT